MVNPMATHGPDNKNKEDDHVKKLLAPFPPEIREQEVPALYILEAATLRAKHAKMFPGVLATDWSPNDNRRTQSARPAPLTARNLAFKAKKEAEEREKEVAKEQKFVIRIDTAPVARKETSTPQQKSIPVVQPTEPPKQSLVEKTEELSKEPTMNINRTEEAIIIIRPAETAPSRSASMAPAIKFIPPHLKNVAPEIVAKVLAAKHIAPPKPTAIRMPKAATPKTAPGQKSPFDPEPWNAALNNAKAEIVEINAWTTLAPEAVALRPGRTLVPGLAPDGRPWSAVLAERQKQAITTTTTEGASGGLTRWPTPPGRARGTAQPRTIRLENLPANPVLGHVSQACKNTGMIDRIVIDSLRRSATVHFVSSEVAKEFHDRSDNGIVVAGTCVLVELSPLVDILPSARREKIDMGATRTVRMVGFEEGDLSALLWELEGDPRLPKDQDAKALKLIAEYFAGTPFDVEFAKMRVNSKGFLEAKIGFANIDIAVKCKQTLSKSECMETANVAFGNDPCEKNCA